MKDELTQLREDLLRAVQPMIEAEGLSNEERLQLVMRLAQVQQDAGLYRRAFELISSIENTDDRLSRYLELLDEVEFALNEKLSPETIEDQNTPDDTSAQA